MSGPAEPGGTRDGDLDLLETMAGRLREGLFPHLPELGTAIDQWISSWDDLRGRLIRVREEVAGASVQSRHAVGDATHLRFIRAQEPEQPHWKTCGCSGKQEEASEGISTEAGTTKWSTCVGG